MKQHRREWSIPQAQTQSHREPVAFLFGLELSDGMTNRYDQAVNFVAAEPSITIEPVSYTHLTLPTNREV